MKTFRIVKCSDSLLWYNKKIGTEFVCERMERLTGGDILWTREVTDYGKLLNWVWAKDVEEVTK